MTQLLRLLGSVLLEGLVSAAHMAWFMVRRRATRARIRALLFESRSPCPSDGRLEAPAERGKASTEADPMADKVPAGVGNLGGVRASMGVVSLLAVGLVVGGCASSPLEQRRNHGTPVPGTSFERQVQEFGDSAAMLGDMSDAQRSLEDDLRAFGSGTSVSEAANDLETLLIDPGSQRSLEDDLREFGKSDPESFWETLLMLGW